MRKMVAAILMVGSFCVADSAMAGRIRVMVFPWFWGPIVVAPRVVVAPPPPAPVGKGFIDLKISPMDAQIMVNGEYVGVASQFSGEPKYLKLSSGSNTIMISHASFAPQCFAVTVEPNRLITLEVNLVPLQAVPVQTSATPVAEPVATAPVAEAPPTYKLDLEKTGYLALTVTPADASLYVDDAPYGIVSQYTGDESIVLRAGPHKVEIVRPGYVSNSQMVDVVSDATKGLSVTLAKQ